MFCRKLVFTGILIFGSQTRQKSNILLLSSSSTLLLLQINAMANKAAGKGYESTDFYGNVKFQFVGIENIHVMRQSLQKMIECK